MNNPSQASETLQQDGVILLDRLKLQSLKDSELAEAKRSEKQGLMCVARTHYGRASMLDDLLKGE